MDKKIYIFIEKISYTLFSNVTSLFISCVLTLIIPKVIGLKSYGYWQLYLFYVSYIGFLHFGWNDGIYLRYGGKEYNELDRRIFSGEFYLQLFCQLGISVLVFIYAYFSNENADKKVILHLLAIAIPLTNIKCMLLYILQASNRIKEYAKVTVLDRLLFVILLFIFFALKEKEYNVVIWADLGGRAGSFLLSLVYCKDLVLRKAIINKSIFVESYTNINVGSKLMLSNILSTLIIGVIKIGIERTWSIEVFGEVSFTLNLSHLILTFINSIGIIIYPMLKRTSTKKIQSTFVALDECVTFFLLAIICLYPILNKFILFWLEEYSNSLIYISILLPICVFESKTALLINTYFKVLRYEKKLLHINLFCFFVSIATTLIFTHIKNLLYMVASISLILGIRTMIAEYYLSKKMRVNLLFVCLAEAIFNVFFVVSNLYLNNWIAEILYLLLVISYYFLRKNILKKSLNIVLNV